MESGRQDVGRGLAATILGEREATHARSPSTAAGTCQPAAPLAAVARSPSCPAGGWPFTTPWAAGPAATTTTSLPLPDGRLLFLVADASDQGARRRRWWPIVRVLLHSCPLSSGVDRLPFCPFREPLTQPPHVILGHLNGMLFENSLPEQFMTAFCGVLDPVDGNLHYANAGHPAPCAGALRTAASSRSGKPPACRWGWSRVSLTTTSGP